MNTGYRIPPGFPAPTLRTAAVGAPWPVDRLAASAPVLCVLPARPFHPAAKLHPAFTSSRHPKMPVVRWGIMGTATIADSVQQAMRDASSAEPVAIASRSLEKAKTWGDERGIPKAYGSYGELLADDEIDAVYIPLPTTMHLEWVVKAAETFLKYSSQP